jgi:hypothetical protein
MPFRVIVAILALLAEFSPAQVPPAPASSLVREEVMLRVHGKVERWRLEWRGQPKPYCPPDDDVAFTCPCMGFAYGESGSLSLVRLQNGVEIDRLKLDALFRDTSGEAVLQRHAANFEHDFSQSRELVAAVKKRPAVRIMNFGDYDHDGQRTEFFLQTEALPCGKSFGVVIGISKINGKLHAFSSSGNPERPLYLQRREWNALRDAKAAPVILVDWQCGDHAADGETEVSLRWSTKGISGVRRIYACTPQLKRGRLLKTEPM